MSRNIQLATIQYGDMIHTLSTILHNCVASNNCCLFEIKGSITKCSFISGRTPR
jgi:hypothetical protein